MDRLVKDNPETNMEVMMNLAFVKNKEVWIRGGAPDGEDCTLIDFSKQLCMINHECQFDDGFPPDIAKDDFDQLGDLFMECSMCGCPIGTAYFIAIQAAELRERLRKHEEKGDRDTAIEPVKDPHYRSGMGYEYHDWLCPNCKRFVAYEPNIDGIPRRCRNCGQLLKKPEQ